MGKKLLVAIGYPIGIIPQDEGIKGIIDIGKDTIILDVKSFTLWQLVFDNIDKDDFVENYNKLYDDGLGLKVIEELISKKIVVEIEIGKNIVRGYESLKSYKLFRQGFGFGVDKNDVSKFNIVTDEKITLDPIKFLLWSSANMTLTIEEFYKSLGDQMDKGIFTLMLLNLYNNNLVYFMR